MDFGNNPLNEYESRRRIDEMYIISITTSIKRLFRNTMAHEENKRNFGHKLREYKSPQKRVAELNEQLRSIKKENRKNRELEVQMRHSHPNRAPEDLEITAHDGINEEVISNRASVPVPYRVINR